jgi:DNA uptake protein ComE-like DNA-binding protein
MKRRDRSIIFLLSYIILCLICIGPLFGARRISLIDINVSGMERLMLVPGITEDIAANIIKYRKEKGYFNDVGELVNVAGINNDLFQQIELYFICTPHSEIKTDEILESFEELRETESEGDTDLDLDNLEKYILNPLDLNMASLSQLMDLPYMTRDIAKVIVKYRKKKRGFKSVGELYDLIPRNVYSKIKPFLIVLRGQRLERIKGDAKFRYGMSMNPGSNDYKEYVEADSKYHNPQYFYSKLRLYYGNKMECGVVLRKDDNSLDLDYENIKDYFLIKRYMLLRNVLAFDTIVVGNYSLDFAQGAFIQPSPFLIRSIPRESKGLVEDSGTHFNEKFYGVAASKRLGSMEIYGFYSDKPLIVDYANPDGTIGTPPTKFYNYQETYLDITSDDGAEHYEFFGELKEKIRGARFTYDLTSSLVLGGGMYEEEFDPYIDPSQEVTSGNNKIHTYLISDYYFRGDKVRLYSVDAEYDYHNFKLLLDFGRSYYHTFKRTERYVDEYANSEPDWSWEYGDCYEVLGVLKYNKYSFWINYHWIDYDYFAFHSSPLMTGLGDETFLRDEEGYIIGGKYFIDNYESQLSFRYGRPIIPPRFYSTQTKSLATWAAKDMYEIYWDNAWDPVDKFTVKFRNTQTYKTRTAAVGEPSIIGASLVGSDFWVHIPYRTIKNRVELIHEPTDMVRLKWRYENVDSAYKDLGMNMNGYVTFGEIKYNPKPWNIPGPML